MHRNQFRLQILWYLPIFVWLKIKISSLIVCVNQYTFKSTQKKEIIGDTIVYNNIKLDSSEIRLLKTFYIINKIMLKRI